MAHGCSGREDKDPRVVWHKVKWCAVVRWMDNRGEDGAEAGAADEADRVKKAVLVHNYGCVLSSRLGRVV